MHVPKQSLLWLELSSMHWTVRSNIILTNIQSKHSWLFVTGKQAFSYFNNQRNDQHLDRDEGGRDTKSLLSKTSRAYLELIIDKFIGIVVEK